MTRTQFTDARRNVQKQIISWISIVVIGMVALIAYLSLVYSSAAILQTVSAYYNTYGFWDMEVASSFLLDEDDLTALRAIDGVELAEPVRTLGAKLLDIAPETTVTVQDLPAEISVPELLEGRLPELSGECAIEQQLRKTLGFAIGDRIRVENSSVSEIEPLRETEYVITGIFRHPDHISFELPEAPYLLVTQDSFNLEDLNDSFMKIRIRVGGVPANRYSSAYMNAVKPVNEAVSAVMAERMTVKEEKLRSDTQAQIDEGQQKLDEASAKLDEASAQLEEASAKLDEAPAKLDEASQQLVSGREKLVSARKQLDDGWAELKEAEEKLNTAKQQLDNGSRALVEAEYQIAAMQGLMYKAQGLIGMIDSLTGASVEDALPGSISNTLQQAKDGLKVYSSGRDLWYSSGEQYLDGLTQYEQGKKRLEQGEREYKDGLAEYEKGREEYEKAKEEYAKGQEDYQKGQEEYARGQAEYDDGVKQLQKAKDFLDNIGPIRAVVWNAGGNAGYVFAGNQANGLSSMSYAFSSLFLVIAVLVIYATVGRMVQEQRALIGTSKALGLYNREVLAKYLFFGISAAVTATVLGVGLTYFVVQKRSLARYAPFFTFETIPLCFRPVETAIVMVLLPLAAGISVWFACKTLIRIPAIKLLHGEQPKSGRKTARRASSRGLYTRLIFRNIKTDLRRVLVTIISIAGCCQLLVGGFMIKHAIERVNDRQFGQIVQFGAELYFDPNEADAERQLADILEKDALPHVLVAKSDIVLMRGGNPGSASVIVTEPDSLEGFYGLMDPESAQAVRPTDEGVLIPIRMSEYQALKPGDILTAYDATLATHEIPISGVYNSHFGSLLFCTPACYEKVFGTEAVQNCFLVRLDGKSLQELEAEVGSIPGFRSLKDAAADRARLDRMSSVLNAMIFMLLGLAGVMSYFIVMNLSVTYIQQKTRELTIMRINGFSVKECVIYVSWDLLITTFAGILAGIVAGHFLGEMVLPVTEGPYMRFVHDPLLRTYLYAALITAGFSALISSASLRRIKHLKLSDII